MRDILDAIEVWHAEGKRYALATVTRTWGSSPRPAGSMMAVREDGLVVGSVSGGCVEGATVQAALEALRSGKARVLNFGRVSDERAWEVGLSCGGEISVLVEPCPFENPSARTAWELALQKTREREAFVALVWLRDDVVRRVLVGPDGTAAGAIAELPEGAIRCALNALSSKESGELELDDVTLFASVHRRRERLIVVGGVHIAVSLVKFARELGFETVVVDPRRAFAASERFPEPPDRLLARWPDKAFEELEVGEDDYAVVLTHDPKIDNPAISLLLKTPAAYIGALGSRATQERRREELLGAGHTEAELARVYGPVGLDIAARSAEEIALSIAAEIVKVRRGRK